MATAFIADEDYDYCDGQPMTDRDINRLLMEYVELALKSRYRKERVYVSANLFIQYTDAHEAVQRVAPDVFLVRGVSKRNRTVYDLDHEKKVPQVAFEFVSTSSQTRDPGSKKVVYQSLGVAEYYVLDATLEQGPPTLRAFHLANGTYHDVPVENGRVHSPALGLDLVVDGTILWLYDPITQRRYELPDTVYDKEQKAQARATEATRRLAQARRRAEQETKRADREAQRANREAQRLAAAEAEVSRLKAQLQAVGQPGVVKTAQAKRSPS